MKENRPAFAGNVEVLRAEEEWQRAGSYSVRIEGMYREHHIPLQMEIDEHDGPEAKYIVLLQDGYPVATCRFFEAGEQSEGSPYAGLPGLVQLGRMVVLERCRGQGFGEKTMREAEAWIRELGYGSICMDSRLEAIGFYEKLGYHVLDPEVVISDPFDCVRMVKILDDESAPQEDFGASERTGARENRYIVLGSGIAGMAAAEAIREEDPKSEILMISAEKELCPNRPMLIREFALDGSGAELFERQQGWPDQYGVQMRQATRVTRIDLQTKCVYLEPVDAPAADAAVDAPRSSVEHYDRLIYALGAEVTIPPIPGADLPCVHVVRTREDMSRIRENMRTARHAVVIGGGMLGLEDAWALREEKLDVAIIEQKQRVAFGQIDQSAGNLMKKRIERMGVPVYLNATVTEIGDGYVTFTQPAPEDETELVTIPADLVILSTGVTPNCAPGAAAGLAVTGPGADGCAGTGSAGESAAGEGTAGEGTAAAQCCSCCGTGCAAGCGAQSGPCWIAADEHCATSDPNVFAAGDAAAVNGRNDAIWDEARAMGRVAGTNAARTALAAGRNAAGAGTTDAGAAANTTGADTTNAADKTGADLLVYEPVVAEHVFVGFDTEVFTMADSSGAGTDGVYIRHADVEIFDYKRERYIRVSLQDGIIAGVLLINAPELAPDLMEAYHRRATEEEARQIVLRWRDSHEVDFKPAAPFRHR